MQQSKSPPLSSDTIMSGGQKDEEQKSEITKVLFFRNLPKNMSENDMECSLQKYGKIEKMLILAQK